MLKATLPWYILQQMLVTINILQSQVTSQEVSLLGSGEAFLERNHRALGAEPRPVCSQVPYDVSLFLREKDHMIKYDQGAREGPPK